MAPKTPNPVDVLVGSRIRLFRMRKKVSQSELGDALGVSFQQIQKYERGVNRVGASRLHRIADFLGVPVSEFFAGANEARSASFTSKADLAFDAQSFRIAEAFAKIADKDLRTSLINLVETMARKVGDHV